MSDKENIGPLLTNHQDAFAYLLDTKIDNDSGGTGSKFNWNIISEFNTMLGTKQTKQTFIAGGLNYHNIKKLILNHNPWGIDVSSGTESEKGKKSLTLMKKFIENVRMADNEKSEKI